jgi:hypothetical protein
MKMKRKAVTSAALVSLRRPIARLLRDESLFLQSEKEPSSKNGTS